MEDEQEKIGEDDASRISSEESMMTKNPGEPTTSTSSTSRQEARVALLRSMTLCDHRVTQTMEAPDKSATEQILHVRERKG